MQFPFCCCDHVRACVSVFALGNSETSLSLTDSITRLIKSYLMRITDVLFASHSL